MQIVVLMTVGFGATVTFFAIRYSQSQTSRISESAIKDRLVAETETVTPAISPTELPEAKAIRIAEEFVAQNGYTNLPVDKDKIVYETVEFGNNLDELLKFRANTLEHKAYGILYKATGTKMGEKGWTVVFQSINVSDDYYKSISRQSGKQVTRENHPIGRAVTMDANFQNLLMEHKTFPLQNVDKKLK